MSTRTDKAVARGRTSHRADASCDERGAGTMLIIATMLAALMLGTALLIIAGYRVAVSHARAAADTVALAAALVAVEGGDGCAAAERTAGENGVRLSDCSQVGDAIDLVVSVRVETDVQAPIEGLPTTVPAIAHAGALGTVDMS